MDFCPSNSWAHYEQLSAYLFRGTLEHIQKSLKDAQLAKSWINGIVLVGGSTCIPNCIAKSLKDFLNGEELNTTTHADEALKHVVQKHRRRFSRATNYRLHRAAQCCYPFLPGHWNSRDDVTSCIKRNTAVSPKQTQMSAWLTLTTGPLF